MRRWLAFVSTPIFFAFFAVPALSYATVPPTLSLSATGTGDQVQVNVTGDPGESVLLSYNESGVGPEISTLGTTNASGSFSDTISSGSYGLTSGTPVSVFIGGTAGPESQTVDWPSITSASAFTLSQNAVVMDAGSSATISATDLGSGTLYVSNNSNPSIANVSVSGSNIIVSGNTSGSTTLTLCTVGESGTCPTVYVTVQQAGESQLSLSNESASIVEGQDFPITLSGGNGNYEVLNNSDAGVIQASISGSTLTLTTGSTSGSSSITVCSTDLSECNVIVATAGSSSSEAVSFSNTAPTVSVGADTTVSVYGPTGVSFYVSSNSSPSSVQANLSGSTLTLAGIEQGDSTIEVCASTGSCASLTATVDASDTGGALTLSQTTLSLLPGQNSQVTITGGEEPYSVAGGTSSVAQTDLSNSTLTVYGIAGGTSSVDVCSAGGGCIILDITVSGSTTSSGIVLGQSSVALTVGQSASVSLSGGSGVYTLSENTAPAVATVTVSGDSAIIAGLAPGSATATVCESGGTCATLSILISTASVLQPPATPSVTTDFTEYLAVGSEDAQVTALQELLSQLGYLSATPTGYFGSETKAALEKFQAAQGISAVGYVGPSTRAALNAAESSSSTNTSTSISDMSLSQLQAEVETLESQLNQVLSRITALQG